MAQEDANGDVVGDGIAKLRAHSLRNSVFLAAVIVSFFVWLVPDLQERFPAFASVILTGLLALVIVDIVGSYLLSRYVRDESMGREAAAPSTRPAPAWLGSLMVVLPAVGIIGSQAVAGTAASDVLGLFFLYVIATTLGVVLGLTSRAQRRK